MDLICNRLIKEKLRGKFVAHLGTGVRANLIMQVHGPSLIPTRINGLKLHPSLPVGHLITTQEFPATRVPRVARVVSHVGVRTKRVAVPDVHDSTRKGRTGSSCDLIHFED